MAGLATTASTLVAPTLAAPGAMQINNAHLVDELAAVTRGYASLFWTVSPTLMRPLLVNHYDLLTTNIGHSPSNRRHLLGLAAGTARLAGLAAYDDDDLGSARRLFVLGANLAREAGDSALLGAILVAHRSVVSLTQHGDGGDRTAGVQAISLLDHAADAVGTTGPAMVNAMILCARAEEYAALKQADAALTDLDRAYAALAHTRSDTTAPPIGLLTTWDESRLDNYRASCLLYLDRATDAAELLEAQVIPIIPDHMAQPRCAALGNLASAYALGSEPEKSASIAIEALATARRVGLADGEKRIRRVRRQLEQWSDLAPVRELDERLVDSSSTIVPDEETP